MTTSKQEWAQIIETVYAVAKAHGLSVLEQCDADWNVIELHVTSPALDNHSRAVFAQNSAPQQVGGVCSFGVYETFETGKEKPFCAGNTGPGFQGWEQSIAFSLEAMLLS